MRYLQSFGLLCALVLTACSLAPEYERPQTAIDRVSDYHSVDREGENWLEWQGVKQAWWLDYKDDTLNDLIQRLSEQNLDLTMAAERILQARSRATIAGADLWPELSIGSSRSRSKSPANNGSRFSDFSTGDFYSTSYDASLSAAWQIDLFRKVADARKSAVDLAQATALDYDALYQSLVAELINLRVGLSTTQQQIFLTEQLVDNGAKRLQSIKRRYKTGAGAVAAYDVEAAREEYAALEARLPVLKRNQRDQLYKIDVLLGSAPGVNEFLLRNEFPAIPPPRDFAVPPPAALLDLRPDIKGNELRLIAASTDIGVAVADLYPGLSISGGYGFQSGDIDNFIRSDQVAWNIVGSITMRLFEGGRLRANIKLQESEARELAASYAQTVLEGLREVETALVQEREMRTEFRAVQDRSYASQTAVRFAKKRYERGLVSFQDYLAAERQSIETSIVLSEAEKSLWQARVALHLALGGDWNKGLDNE